MGIADLLIFGFGCGGFYFAYKLLGFLFSDRVTSAVSKIVGALFGLYLVGSLIWFVCAVAGQSLKSPPVEEWKYDESKDTFAIRWRKQFEEK